MFDLKVGAGKACISPTKELFPVPGYEGVDFQEILVDLQARAIVLDNGVTRYLFIALDLPTGMENSFKAEVCKKYGFEQQFVCACGTHNHSAPLWTDGFYFCGGTKTPEEKKQWQRAYHKVVEAGIYAAVDQAIATERPAKYGFGEGKSYINVNRDFLYEDGNWMQGQNFEAPSDKTLAVMKFEDFDGNLIAAILNYPCHLTTAFTAYDADGKVKITPGFGGIACNYVEERFGGNAIVMWTSGAAGNQNPLFSGEGFPREFAHDGYAEGLVTPPGTQYMIQRHHGQVHAIDAIKVLNQIQCKRSQMKITAEATIVSLPGHKFPAGVDTDLHTLRADNFVKRYRPELVPNGTRLEKNMATMEPGDDVKLRLQLAVLGDTAVIGVAGEPYNELGSMLKEASPFRNAFVVTHTDTPAGYIMNDAMAKNKVFKFYSQILPGHNDAKILEGLDNMFFESLNQ